MEVGVLKEIKNYEQRVGMVPSTVRELVANGHNVYVQSEAGLGVGLTDEQYQESGAVILATPEEVCQRAKLIIKVKEPQPSEWPLLREDHILFTYLHLAADKPQTQALCNSGCAAIAYETITDDYGALPLLAPMSEVAGRMSIQVGAHALENAQGGAGVLLAGVPGVLPGKVVVLGGGTAGKNAARLALGLGAQVTVIDANVNQLRLLDSTLGHCGLRTLYSNKHNVEESVVGADLVIGSVLIPGAAAPKLVSEELVKAMKVGSVVVDIAIDQGGCFATSHPTSHKDPTFVKHGVVHYCVTNMPGAVARTSTFALSNATSRFILKLANMGLVGALQQDAHLLRGLNVYKGQIVYAAVAQALNLPYTAPSI